MQGLTVHTITLIVRHWRNRRVDGYLMEIRAAKPGNLRIDIGMYTASQQRVIAEVDAWNDVRRAERNLLGFGKKIVRITIEHHAPYRRNRHHFLGNKLRGIENVKAEPVALLLGKYLHTEFPFRKISGLDRLP